METNKIDVLTALDLFISAHVDGQMPKSDQTAIRNVRAAVAELIEAAREFRAGTKTHVSDCVYCHDRCARLDAALANAGGAA